jgi:hypothetical protein
VLCSFGALSRYFIESHYFAEVIELCVCACHDNGDSFVDIDTVQGRWR